MSNEESLKQELLETDVEFRRLHDEHQNYERRLGELQQKSFFSEEDEVEEKSIKLHKLRLKDRMEMMLRIHREAGVSVR